MRRQLELHRARELRASAGSSFAVPTAAEPRAAGTASSAQPVPSFALAAAAAAEPAAEPSTYLSPHGKVSYQTR